MIKALRSIKQFLFTYDWEVVEVQGAAFKIAWGLWLLMPFASFRAIQGYNAVGTENYWGVGLLFYGLVHFYAIVGGSRNFRRALTFGAFLFWLFTILLIWQQSHTASLLPMFGIIALFMGLNFIRIGRERYYVNKRVKDVGPPAGISDRRLTHE